MLGLPEHAVAGARLARPGRLVRHAVSVRADRLASRGRCRGVGPRGVFFVHGEVAGSARLCVLLFPRAGRRRREAYSRMFAPGLGIGEDPATGGASGPLGCYLVRHGAVTADRAAAMLSLQGVKMGRPSHVHISIGVEDNEIVRVRVGGAAVFVGEGFLVSKECEMRVGRLATRDDCVGDDQEWTCGWRRLQGRRRAPAGCSARRRGAGAAGPSKAKLRTPAQLNEKAPDTFKAKFDTSKGVFVIEVHRDWVAARRRSLLQPREERLLRRHPVLPRARRTSWRSSG